MNEDHLDAEVVAAWLDGSLDRATRAEAEGHAADCARCQAVLAAMVRTDPEPHRKAAWFTAPLRWAFPFATVAAALTIWIAVDRDAPPQAPGSPPVTTGTPAPKEAEQPMAGAADSAPPAAAPARSPVPSQGPQAAGNTRVPPRAARTADRPPREEAVAPLVANETVSVDQLARDRATAQRELPKAGAVPASPQPAPPPPPPPAQAQTQVMPPPPQARTQAQTQEMPPAQAQTQVSAASPRLETKSTTSAEQRFRIAGALGAGVREFASPDLAARWRLGANGAIHRSTDAGRTWGAQTSGVTTELLSASAPSAVICWIVGRSGVVLLSTDGATWRRVAFPELVDLRAVTAADARTAAVTTADGRVFRTADGGVTWVR